MDPSPTEQECFLTEEMTVPPHSRSEGSSTTWQQLYHAALFETNRTKIPERVSAA